MGWAVGFLAILAGLVAYRFEIIDSPPYWDSAMGVLYEANFLADSHFDYYRLWTTEKRFIEGGPGVYLISVMPTLFAGLMVVSPNPRATLILGHLLEFAYAAGALLITWRMARPRCGSLVAGLAVIVVATTPLFVTQVDMLGIDVPMIFWALSSVAASAAERFPLAAFFSLIAFFHKPSGAIVTLATIIYLSLRLTVLIGRAKPGAAQSIWFGLSSHFFALSIEMAAFLQVTQLSTSSSEKFESDPWAGVRALSKVWLWAPDLTIAAAAALVIWLIATAWPMRRSRARTIAERWSRVATAIEADPIGWIGWASIVGTTLAVVLIYPIPRYLAILVPIVWLIIVRGACGPKWGRLIGGIGLVGVASVNLYNRDGVLFMPLPASDVADHRTGAFLERSREYLADHRSNIAAVAAILADEPNQPIIATPPFTHFLAFPRLGYTPEPRRGYSTNTFVAPTVKPVAKIVDDQPPTSLIVSITNRFSRIAGCAIPTPDASERIVYRDEFSEPLVVFERDWRKMAPGQAAVAAYQLSLWPEQARGARAILLAQQGRTTESRQALLEILAEKPYDETALLILAALALSEGKAGDAIRYSDRAVKYHPSNAMAHSKLGEARLAAGELAAAAESLRRAISLAPAFAEPRRLLATLLDRQGKPLEAIEELRRAVESDPKDDKAWNMLATGEIVSGQPMMALQTLTKALDANPENLQARYMRAAVLRDLGRLGPAIAELETLRKRAPAWLEPVNDLAWILATSPSEGIRDGARSVALAEFICRVSQRSNPNHLDTLAAALAETGSFDKAQAVAGEAIAKAEQKRDADLAARIKARRDLYQKGHSYRDQPRPPAPPDRGTTPPPGTEPTRPTTP